MSKIFKMTVKKIIRTIEYWIFGEIIAVSVFSLPSVTVKSLFSSEKFTMPKLRDIQGQEYDIIEAYTETVPELNIFSIEQGIFSLGREEVFTSDGNVLNEITSQKINPMSGVSSRKLRDVRYLKGRVLCLSLSGLENNYYHFSVEFLARWYMWKCSGLEFDWVDYPQQTSFQRQFIEILGIPKHKLIPFKEGEVIQADVLIVPQLINNWEFRDQNGYMHYMKRWLPSWTSNIYRELDFPRLDGKLGIYISRQKARYRRVVNEDQVLSLLERFGVQSYCLEDMTVMQQLQLFSQARLIIAPHGAGLVNMVHCSHPFHILEIYPDGYHDSSYRVLSRVLDCDYHFMVANPHKTANVPANQEDMIVDLNLLEVWMEKHEYE